MLKGLNVFLVGMMGSGKTTVGNILAQKLNYRFFDTDVLIERVMGQSVSEIFATSGEDSFRDMETQVLGNLSAYTKSIIATGGGIVIKPANWSYLHHGVVIWLDAPVEVILARLADDNTRPLLQETDPEQKLNELLEKRTPLYSLADLQIHITADQTPETIANQIMTKIPSILK